MEAELATFRSLASFHRRPGLCAQTGGPEFEQGRTTAVSFARLVVGSKLQAATARAAPDWTLAWKPAYPLRCPRLQPGLIAHGPPPQVNPIAD